jgi:hypothetical protein
VGALIRETGLAQERMAVEEIAPHVALRALDLALGLGSIRAAGADAEAPVGGEAQELGILQEPAAARPVVLDDHTLHLVEEDVLGHAAEGWKARSSPSMTVSAVWRGTNSAYRSRE